MVRRNCRTLPLTDLMEPNSTLLTLFRRAVAGDRDAGDRLFARAADRLLLFIRLRLGAALRARLEPADVLQEVFTHAHRDLRRFQPEQSSDPDRAFLHWLCALAENRIRDLAAYHRARRRDAAREERQVTEVLRELQRRGHGPATSMVRRDERDRLANALDGLPDGDRDALLLRYFEGLTIDAIAERLGTSQSSVRRALGRATVQLGRQLGAEVSR
jgi:RNA polymerase sigma-70 factor (ECF subfamily)